MTPEDTRTAEEIACDGQDVFVEPLLIGTFAGTFRAAVEQMNRDILAAFALPAHILDPDR